MATAEYEGAPQNVDIKQWNAWRREQITSQKRGTVRRSELDMASGNYKRGIIRPGGRNG